MTGQGTYALRSLLDSHPDLLVYPFSLSKIFEYWKRDYRGIRRMGWKEALPAILPWILGDGSFRIFDRIDGTSRIPFPGIVRHVLESFHDVEPRYAGRAVNYHAFCCDAFVFAWEDAMGALASWLGVPYDPILAEMTIMGLPERGAKTDGQAAMGRISPRG